MVIAIDYDGTITDNTPFPYKANIREEAVKGIKELYSQGHTLVLWTARNNKYYDECIERLKEIDLYKYFNFDYSKYGKTGKLEADFYIDDRSCINEINWNQIVEYLKKGCN